MTEHTYSLAFTSGALLYHASLTVAQLWEALGDWDAVRARVMDDNLLQMRTTSAARRIFQEVASRLKCLTPAALALLCTGTPQEQRHLLWLAICKRYRFIYEFASTVVYEKFIRLDFDLGYDAYDVYFNNKAEWHPEVAGVAPSTRKKLRQVLFRMMRQVGLLTQDDRIQPLMLSPRARAIIVADAPRYLLAFPISSPELEAARA